MHVTGFFCITLLCVDEPEVNISISVHDCTLKKSKTNKGLEQDPAWKAETRMSMIRWGLPCSSILGELKRLELSESQT
ncbi:hypothetical protein AVEN_135470-1 [Araneus ventricosus]|uniref:Uncharacterized protein n=1 Tax=Araneus ventricosus TaxID=182803 RepID=A0A4Y2BF07_ARAVE|nr:hypothetical protein AVEN_135470-1 [Araneus ventricosus]